MERCVFGFRAVQFRFWFPILFSYFGVGGKRVDGSIVPKERIGVCHLGGNHTNGDGWKDGWKGA